MDVALGISTSISIDIEPLRSVRHHHAHRSDDIVHTSEGYTTSKGLISTLLSSVMSPFWLVSDPKCCQGRRSCLFPCLMSVALLLVDFVIASGRLGYSDNLEHQFWTLTATCGLLWSSGAKVGRQAAMTEVCASTTNHMKVWADAAKILSTVCFKSARATF